MTRARLKAMGSAQGRSAPLARVRPGWFVLAGLLVYALVATSQWRAAALELRDVQSQLDGVAAVATDGVAAVATDGLAAVATDGVAASPAATVVVEAGLWFPIPGARVPTDDDHLPGAQRAYRSGVAEGFSFWQDSSGVPVVHGTPVIAVGSGEVIRVDSGYVELSAAEWEVLLASVEGGASESDLDRLRGRQVWLRLDDGRVVRYGHLASVRSGLSVGQRVTRGRVIGTVGNSGTPDAVAGRVSNARLHFEVRQEDGGYFGQGRDPDEVRLAAISLFTGP